MSGKLGVIGRAEMISESLRRGLVRLCGTFRGTGAPPPKGGHATPLLGGREDAYFADWRGAAREP